VILVMPNSNDNPNTPKTLLCFDFGMKHIGVAVGQTITQTATPLTTIAAQDGIPNWLEIKQLIEKWRVNELVVGIPLNMDDSTQLMTFRSRRFRQRLITHFQLPTHEVDERLSSWEANDRRKAILKGAKPDQKSHAEAAAILLEQWMRDQR